MTNGIDSRGTIGRAQAKLNSIKCERIETSGIAVVEIKIRILLETISSIGRSAR